MDEAFLELMDRVTEASVLAAAWSTGLLPAILEQPGTLSELCDRTGLSGRAAAAVLDLLVALSVIAEEDGVYALSGAISLPLPADTLGAMFGSLPARLRGARSTLAMDGELHRRGAVYAAVVDGLEPMQRAQAEELADALGPAEHVLDLGAGSGVWSLAMARRGARVTAVDLPPVIEVFARHAQGVDATTLAGDYHAVELPAVDRVILGNVLHLEDAAGARALIGRAAAALVPGGELVVIEPTGRDTPERARRSAAYTVQLMLRTDHGWAWRAGAVRGWVEAAGLGAMRVIPLRAGHAPLEALVGRRLA